MLLDWGYVEQVCACVGESRVILLQLSETAGHTPHDDGGINKHTTHARNDNQGLKPLLPQGASIAGSLRLVDAYIKVCVCVALDVHPYIDR